MSSPFLTNPTNAGVSALLTSGTQRLNVSTITSQALIQGLPVCTNTSKQLISRQLQQADLGFTVLTNPYVGTLTTDGITSDQVNLVQQASVVNPPAGTNILWTLTTDGRAYITDSDGTQNKVSYATDTPGGSIISNGIEFVEVNMNGSITLSGGRVESLIDLNPVTGQYGASENQCNFIVTDPLCTEVLLPASVVGAIYNIRREYPAQMGEVWPSSVFGVVASGSTIEGLASFPVAPYTSIRVMFVGTSWVLC